MARLGLTHLLVILVVGVLGASCEDVAEFPSLMTALGSKMGLADDYYDDDDGDIDEPQAAVQPCCFPLAWEGRSVHELGVSSRPSPHGRGHHRGKSGPKLLRTVDQFYVDSNNKRIAGYQMRFQHHRGGKSDFNVSWIFSVSSNSTGDFYIFDPVAKKCQHRVLKNAKWRRQCIPTNATSRGSFSLGPVGGLAVQAWTFGGRSRSAAIEGDRRKYPGPHMVFGAKILVVPSTCVPVIIQQHGFIFRGIDEQQQNDLSSDIDFEDTGLLNDDDSYYGNYMRRRMMQTDSEADDAEHPRPKPRPKPRPHGFGFIDNAYFSNVQTKITDPSVFTVPTYCKKGDSNTEHFGDDTGLPTILERFLTL